MPKTIQAQARLPRLHLSHRLGAGADDEVDDVGERGDDDHAERQRGAEAGIAAARRRGSAR